MIQNLHERYPDTILQFKSSSEKNIKNISGLENQKLTSSDK
jgi:hypothetical protein